MESNFNKCVGQKLYTARKAKGYSRAKVGELVGLHETTVKRYEDGDIKTLDIDRLKTFARVLGTPASELLGWVSDSDDNLDVMMNCSQDFHSGCAAAKEEMYRVYGKDHSILGTRLVDDKVALLYYKAMERNGAAELTSILQSIENLDPDDIAKIRCTLHAYRHADQPIKEIVDTALKPYYPQDIEG